METRQTIGAKIAQERERQHLSIAELADLADIKAANLSRIEAGRYNINADLIISITGALGCDLVFHQSRPNRLALLHDALDFLLSEYDKIEGFPPDSAESAREEAERLILTHEKFSKKRDVILNLADEMQQELPDKYDDIFDET